MLIKVNASFLVLFALYSAAFADVAGRAHVIDGDTFRIAGQSVRLHGIDAPEMQQHCRTEHGIDWACGAWVRVQAARKFEGQFVRCAPVDVDRYQRIVAICRFDGLDVGQWLVGQGLAFAYRKYSMEYDLDEKGAAINDRGLHASRVQSPAQFRATRAKGRIAPDAACAIKGNISTTGQRIYHVVGARDYERTGIRPENGERWFCSEAEARQAGWRRAKR